jgi:hypothetical protein
MTTDPEGQTLIRNLGLAIEALRQHTFPALLVVDADDDGETYQALRCPTCRELITDVEYELFAVDWSMHQQPGTDSSVENRYVSFEPEDHDLDETLYYLHDQHPVSLPDGFREEWS